MGLKKYIIKVRERQERERTSNKCGVRKGHCYIKGRRMRFQGYLGHSFQL
jgi:hypothetical protein